MRISGAAAESAAADGVENSNSAARLLNWTCSGCCMIFSWEFQFRFVDDLRRRCRPSIGIKNDGMGRRHV